MIFWDLSTSLKDIIYMMSNMDMGRFTAPGICVIVIKIGWSGIHKPGMSQFEIGDGGIGWNYLADILI